jgi:uncharacterized membrane protein HdeD (DUF308 family)
MSNFKSTSRIRNQMPQTETGRKPVIGHENGSKNTGKLWISTSLTGALLLIIGLVLFGTAGVSIVSMVLIPAGVACFIAATIIKPLEMIHAELRELNAKR